MLMTREEIIELLEVKTLKVTFTKVNGEERVMNCTLREDILPQEDGESEFDSRAHNPNVVPVWDVDKEGWRSFRLDNLKAVE